MKDGVFIDDCTYDDFINTNEWTSGETYGDYITVQPGERFAYGSVYHNQTLDHHPPFYYAMLHTVCSLFPNSFSYWYSYFLNVIFLILTQIFLFKFAKSLSGSDLTAVFSCLLYGAGIGALSTFIFLRQYSLLTAVGTMYCYFNARLYKSENLNLKRNLPAVAVTAFLSFMTHYTAIAFVGVFTACFCIYLLCRKKIKKMFIYGGSVLAALLLYFLVYPASLKQIGGYSTDSTYLSFESQVRRLFSYLTGNNLGFKISVFKSDKPAVILAVIVLLAAIAVPLCVLFRKETWFVRAKDKTLAFVKETAVKLKSFNFVWLFTAAGIVAMVLVVAKISDVVRMGAYSMRYIFMTFPLACALVCVAFSKIVESLPKLKRFAAVITAVAVAAVAVKVNVTSECQFLFEHSSDYQPAEELLRDKNCVVILDSLEDTWLMTCFVQYVQYADNVFFTTADTIEENADAIASLDGKINYVLADTSVVEFTDEEFDSLGLSSDDGSQDADGESGGFSLTGLDNVVEQEEITYCNDTINGFNGGEGYTPLYWMNIQGSAFCMLEMN
jgi:hypothetical protein